MAREFPRTVLMIRTVVGSRIVDRAGQLASGDRQLADELGGLSLSNGFALLRLFAEHDVERFCRAAPRWHARLVLEAGDLSLEEAQAVLGALALLPGPTRPAALELLATVCREHKAPVAITGHPR